MVITIENTFVDGKNDYPDQSDYLSRGESYSKTYKKTSDAKKRDSVYCYYIESGTLYINGNAYKNKLVTKRAQDETGSQTVEKPLFLNLGGFCMTQITLDPSGKFKIFEVIGNTPFHQVENEHNGFCGRYLLYENKIILRTDKNKMELQFYKEGDKWHYDAESSFGVNRMEIVPDYLTAEIETPVE